MGEVVAAWRVDVRKAAVEWVKLAPPGHYTVGMLAKSLADHYHEDPAEVRKVVQALVRGGALLKHEGGGKKRQRLWVGTGKASDIVLPRKHPERESRASVRERGSKDLVGTTQASDLPKRPEHRRPRVMRW